MVMIIMGIMTSIATLGFRKMQMKAAVENDAKRIYALTSRARQYSFTRKTDLYLDFNAAGQFRIEDSGGNLVDGMFTDIQTSYAKSAGTYFKNGFTINPGYIKYTGSETGSEYTCVLIEQGRVKLGSFNGTKCVAR